MQRRSLSDDRKKDTARGQTPIFFFDLRSPYAWLMAERLPAVFQGTVLWLPVREIAIARANDQADWAVGPGRAFTMGEIESAATLFGFGSVRWPNPFPVDSTRAMHVACYAHTVGLLKEFALAIFRHQFVDGNSTNEWYAIAEIVARVGLEPRPALDAPLEPQAPSMLASTTAYAIGRRIPGVPALAVGGRIFWGLERLAEAGEANRQVGESSSTEHLN